MGAGQIRVGKKAEGRVVKSRDLTLVYGHLVLNGDRTAFAVIAAQETRRW